MDKCSFCGMPCQAIGPTHPSPSPFSSRCPQTSSLRCQAGLEQTELFSLASHQLPQRRVKQAVTGLVVPSTTILLSHMGTVGTVQDDTGSAGSACHDLTRERFRKRNNNYCRPDHGMCLAFISGARAAGVLPNPPTMAAPGHPSRSCRHALCTRTHSAITSVHQRAIKAHACSRRQAHTLARVCTVALPAVLCR